MGGAGEDDAHDIQLTSDGGYIVAGFSNSIDGDVSGNHGGFDYWIVKIDATGNITWQKCLGGSQTDYAYSIKQTSDGGYVVGGYEYSTDGDVTGNHGKYDYWVLKLNNLGALIWQKTLGGSKDDYAYSLQLTNDGGFYISGDTQSNDGDVTNNHQATGLRGLWDYWTVKLSSDGVLPLTLLSFNAVKQLNDVLTLWQTTSEINVSHFELQRSADAVNYISIATINASNSSNLNNYRFTDINAVFNNPANKLYYRLKMVDKDGKFKYSNVAVIEIPAGQVISIYPNPARNNIKINTAQALTTIQILDIAGKLVKQFKPMPGNSYGISDLTNGVYMLRLICNQGQTILKFEKQ
jgi:hypothetical protein